MLMTWMLMWLNWNVATINATLQILDIYIYIYRYRLTFPKSLHN